MLIQDETPLVHSLVCGEGVVGDAPSVVHFNLLQRLNLSHVTLITVVMELIRNFLYLFVLSTLLGVALSSSSSRSLFMGRAES